MAESSASKATLKAFFFSGRLSVSQAMPVVSSMLAWRNLLSAI
jgi:hypothetical protein